MVRDRNTHTKGTGFQRVFDGIPLLVERYAFHIVLATLLLTGVFAIGLADLQVEEDFDRYAEDIPEQETLDDLEAELETETSTVIIYADDNVLTRSSLQTILATEAELTESSESLAITRIDSPASFVAQVLDPTATTAPEQQEVIEGASDEQLTIAIEAAAASPEFQGMISNDFDGESPHATHALIQIAHSFADDPSDGEILDRQLEIEERYDQHSGDAVAWSDERLFEESNHAIDDSMALILPFVSVLLLGFLLLAYRDPIDVTLALLTLVMTLVWTFGAAGFASIPFDQVTIATVVLLLGLGIDFGIHVINRYREERVAGNGISESIIMSSRQLNVAFFIVSITAAIGFGANVVSELEPIRNFGLVAALGILFMLVLFTFFLPALKLSVDSVREQYSIPTFGSSPFGFGPGSGADVLTLGYRITRTAPIVFVIATIVVAGGAGVIAMDMDREYAAEDFLPPEENPAYTQHLPAELQPNEYAAAQVFTTFDEEFAFNPDESVIFAIEGDLTADGTLTEIQQAEENAPASFTDDEGAVMRLGILPIIEQYQWMSPEFASLVEANDENGNGLPDTNLDQIYDALFDSPYGDQVALYLSEDRDVMKIEYATRGSADRSEVAQDAELFAENFPADTSATGEVVVFDQLDEEIVDAAVLSLVLAIIITGLFLVGMYRTLESRGSLGIVNLFSILVSIALLGGTMRALEMPLNSINATIFAVMVGIGIAYSVHITHRFVAEYKSTGDFDQSMLVTLRGTGGALTGSMLTTVFTMAGLLLALTPLLSQFGVLIAIGIAYSYLASLVVLPPTLLIWHRFHGR